MSVWKLYQENTYVSECGGKELQQGHPELLRKAWRLQTDFFFFLTFFFFPPILFFHLKSPQVISRVIHILNFTHRGSGCWIRLHEKNLVKCETVTAVM